MLAFRRSMTGPSGFAPTPRTAGTSSRNRRQTTTTRLPNSACPSWGPPCESSLTYPMTAHSWKAPILRPIHVTCSSTACFPGAGTCVTMPVLYLAIGRRLKFPLKSSPSETAFLLVRWDASGKNHFNIECALTAFTPLDDEHFHHHPKPLTDKELESGDYLRSLPAARGIG